jgi:hypothetical protein
MLPANYPGLVPIRAPEKLAAAMINLMTQENGEGLRQMFLARFTLEAHLTKLAEALASIEHPAVSAMASPVRAAR